MSADSRKCDTCEGTEDLMDEKDRCWPCNGEIQRERAIEDYAERRGLRY